MIRRLITGVALLCTLGFGRLASAKPPVSLQGTLLSLPGSGPVVRVRGKDMPLAARTSWLFHTLQDRRLQSREVRLEGTTRPDGTFEVEHLFTVHRAKLYRVRYFCEVCNIEAFEPGDCVCCQQPTELQEIPVGESDTNIKDIIVTH